MGNNIRADVFYVHSTDFEGDRFCFVGLREVPEQTVAALKGFAPDQPKKSRRRPQGSEKGTPPVTSEGVLCPEPQVSAPAQGARGDDALPPSLQALCGGSEEDGAFEGGRRAAVDPAMARQTRKKESSQGPAADAERFHRQLFPREGSAVAANSEANGLRKKLRGKKVNGQSDGSQDDFSDASDDSGRGSHRSSRSSHEGRHPARRIGAPSEGGSEGSSRMETL